jgi:hypothetical protein
MKKIVISMALLMMTSSTYAALECQVKPGVNSGLFIDKQLTQYGKLYQVAVMGNPFTYIQVANNSPEFVNGRFVMFGNGFYSSNYLQRGQVSMEKFIASYYVDASLWQCRNIRADEMLDRNIKEQARAY